jgi:dynein intermediate chain
VPISSFTVGDGRAINKLAWEKKDGRFAALGGSDGLLHIYDVGSDLSNPKENEWPDFQRALQSLKQAGQTNSLSAMSLS